MTVPTLVLASVSPRRRQLLTELNLHPEVRPADVDETPRAGESPDDYVTRLAVEKARCDVRAGEVALGADTIVVLDDALLGKPNDPAEAAVMLGRLSGRTHRVLSAQAIIGRGPAGELSARAGALSVARVTFRSLGDAEISAYVATGEPMDKAGAYALQGGGAAFVEKLEGRRDTVIGLDLSWTLRLLAGVGIERRPERQTR